MFTEDEYLMVKPSKFLSGSLKRDLGFFFALFFLGPSFSRQTRFCTSCTGLMKYPVPLRGPTTHLPRMYYGLKKSQSTFPNYPSTFSAVYVTLSFAFSPTSSAVPVNMYTIFFILLAS